MDKEPSANSKDELYCLFIFEKRMRDTINSIHPMQFIFSTTEPGLSGAIGPLEQGWVCLHNFLHEDPQLDLYEEVN